MKRYLALLIALLLAVLMLSACNDGAPDSPDTQPPAETSAPETAAPVTDFVVGENGTATFPLIRYRRLPRAFHRLDKAGRGVHPPHL